MRWEKFPDRTFFSTQTLLGLAQYAESVLLYNLESNQKITTSWKLSKYTQLNPLAVQYLLGKSVALNVLLVKQVLLNAKRFLSILSSRACQGLWIKVAFEKLGYELSCCGGLLSNNHIIIYTQHAVLGYDCCWKKIVPNPKFLFMYILSF